MKHLMKRAWTKYALVALVTALVVAPAVAVASHGFTDVPDSHLFHNNIQWMKDNGVTLGCNPPANDKYCPNNTVNRGQMAAFMQRLAENKVVDAATAVTADSATNATNADKLDGYDASNLIPVVTRMHYTGSTFTDPTSSQSKVRVLGSFTKESADTDIVIEWNDHVLVADSFCHYQLRVDDLKDNGSGTLPYDHTAGGNAVNYATGPFAVTAVFDGLTAGTHELSVYVRGFGTGCTLNDGNFSNTAIITETLMTQGVATASISGSEGTGQGGE